MHFVSKIHYKDTMVSSALFPMALNKGLQLKKCNLYLFENHAFPQEIWVLKYVLPGSFNFCAALVKGVLPPSTEGESPST